MNSKWEQYLDEWSCTFHYVATNNGSKMEQISMLLCIAIIQVQAYKYILCIDMHLSFWNTKALIIS